MWSLGVVLVYIANDNKHLFEDEYDVMKWKGDTTPIRRPFIYPVHTLTLSLLSVDKHKRPTAGQVLEDQFRNEHRQNIPKPIE